MDADEMAPAAVREDGRRDFFRPGQWQVAHMLPEAPATQAAERPFTPPMGL
jgi:hypothetical protein